MLLSSVLAASGQVRVFRAATVVDGTGAPRYLADVAVEGARIVGIRRPGDADPIEAPERAVETDAAGLVLAPGFIDLSLQPADGVAPDERIRRGVTTATVGAHGAGAPSAGNTVMLVRLGDLRRRALGAVERPATAAEITELQRMLGEELDGGAAGLASGTQADAAELEALRRVVAERGGLWAPDVDESEPVELRSSLTLEEAVHRRSRIPAERLGLHLGDTPRGVIREGAAADLVLLDPETFDDRGAAPTGIREVLVSGVPVLTAGETTGATPGRALRMPPPPHRATVPRTAHEIDSDAAPFVLHAGTAVHPQDGLQGIAGLLRDALGLGEADAALPAIALRVDSAVGGPEAFRIRVGASGIDVAGGSAEGVFRGTTVLRQLCDPERAVGSRLPAGTWWGEPAFGWRGLMLDVARHFRPVDEVRRMIDLLAAHHLNVLHLHLSDDQGWRFEVPGYPRLTEVGAVRQATQLGHGPLATVEPGVHEGFYRAEEIRGLVAYAAERFVTVVPEVELPGHVQAALAAYPELGNTDVSGSPEGAWERFGVNRRVLAPTEASLAFGRAAIDALCEQFDAEWIGIGGDEVPTDEWAASPAAHERMRELGLSSPEEVQPWFTRAFVAHVRSHGRTALAWDEVLAGDVPEGVRVLAWRGPVAMAEALRRDIPVVACPDLEVYLDYPQSDSEDEPIRVGPPLPIERAYTLRVPDGAEGGQANVWSEHLPTRDRVDFAVFPRLCAIAERLWEGGEAPSVDGFAQRLPVQLRRLAAAGVQYRPLDGPTPAQRRPGVPGKPLTLAQREAIVADLVAGLSTPRAGGPAAGGGGSE
ncbi:MULTISPECIES: family 20 glycosylhydrolase [unclassified Microbacterium]|uniref:family 20 glycosylhydrolase n=1 Tax=unclassified Microbacterium TaxID=2609290 RepID=UPI0012FAC7AD|nr:family 20 glycosylhydrolase [Microbacterium sp. MAH-37]MVQ42098.1 family 20 glycosylhydrolase [Microbacterium sp. MAH-37]